MAETVKVEDLRAGDTVPTVAEVVQVCIGPNGVEVRWLVHPPRPEHFLAEGTDIENVTHPTPPEPPA